MKNGCPQKSMGATSYVHGSVHQLHNNRFDLWSGQRKRFEVSKNKMLHFMMFWQHEHFQSEAHNILAALLWYLRMANWKIWAWFIIANYMRFLCMFWTSAEFVCIKIMVLKITKLIKVGDVRMLIPTLDTTFNITIHPLQDCKIKNDESMVL